MQGAVAGAQGVARPGCVSIPVLAANVYSPNRTSSCLPAAGPQQRCLHVERAHRASPLCHVNERCRNPRAWRCSLAAPAGSPPGAATGLAAQVGGPLVYVVGWVGGSTGQCRSQLPLISCPGSTRMLQPPPLCLTSAGLPLPSPPLSPYSAACAWPQACCWRAPQPTLPAPSLPPQLWTIGSWWRQHSRRMTFPAAAAAVGAPAAARGCWRRLGRPWHQRGICSSTSGS